MLEMRSVTKQYKRRGVTINALDDVSLRVSPGEFVAIVGPSGSGKSTFLLAFGGMLSPTRGSVLVDGQALYDLPYERRSVLRREKIGFVFQTFNLVSYFTALENVQVPLFLAGRPGPEQRERAAALLEGMGLKDRLDHKPHELSVGQQQRVALARMMANDPPVILADEPTGSLDPENAESVIGFLAALHSRGRTILMVTHNAQTAGAASRALQLVNGRLLGFSEETSEAPALIEAPGCAMNPRKED